MVASVLYVSSAVDSRREMSQPSEITAQHRNLKLRFFKRGSGSGRMHFHNKTDTLLIFSYLSLADQDASCPIPAYLLQWICSRKQQVFTRPQPDNTHTPQSFGHRVCITDLGYDCVSMAPLAFREWLKTFESRWANKKSSGCIRLTRLSTIGLHKLQ